MNPLLLTDGYKTSHHQMYPKGTNLVYSNFTPRSNKYGPKGVDKVVSFGQQMMMTQIHEAFEKEFFQNFYNDAKIQQTYLEEKTDCSSNSYSDIADENIKMIEKFITITSGSYSHLVELNLFSFIKFLMIKNITEINDNLEEILDDYIDFYGIQTEYEGIYDYDDCSIVYDHNKNHKIVWEVDQYFEKLQEDIDSNVNCIDARETLNRVVREIFKDSSYYENEHVVIKLPSMHINCDDSTIQIEYINKDTNKKYSGNVKVSNLASYALNYKLFENYITFKKNI